MTQTTLQNRFDILPPIMKWQFGSQVEKKCQEKEFASKEDLNNLMTDVETAATIMKHLLMSENASATSMHRYLKHFDRPANMKKPVGILTDALEKGDEMIFRFCYLAKQNGFSLADNNLSHPGLICNDEEFEKWLLLMTAPALKKFNPENMQYMKPYLEWIETPGGKNFQNRRTNYTQALQWYKMDFDPIAHNSFQKVPSVHTLQRDS
ncbi:MAG: hypothetical protein IKQ99_00635 [Alphaproteobacteria bacterium]|nr:hypothetical protein [Alphaproteobacteria bacterium]